MFSKQVQYVFMKCVHFMCFLSMTLKGVEGVEALQKQSFGWWKEVEPDSRSPYGLCPESSESVFQMRPIDREMSISFLMSFGNLQKEEEILPL